MRDVLTMGTRVGALATLAVVLAAALVQPAAAARARHLSGGGTASISQVAMNVKFGASGSASGSFVCLMAGRSAFVLKDFGLVHNMIVHATPSTGTVTGSVATFAGAGRVILDGKKKMAIHIQVQVDVAAQMFRLTVVEIGTLPWEHMLSGRLSLRG